MTDEITSALAKVPNLRVVGRSSAFQFKDQSKDLRAIGEALGATYLIDGSVRRAGNRVRVTAQLVKADDGINLWTDSYDRELTDVFAIEEDIAQAIAGALRAPLGLAAGERLVSNRTTDVDSYQDYLRGRSLVRGRDPRRSDRHPRKRRRARPELRAGLGNAGAGLSLAARLQRASRAAPTFPSRRRAVSCSRRSIAAERAARRAIELDPRHDGGYAALATILATRGEWLEANDLFAQAFAIDPNNPEALYRYGQMLNIVGRVAESLRIYEQLRALEPLVPIYQFQAGLADVYRRPESRRPSRCSKRRPTTARHVSIATCISPGPTLQRVRFADSADALLALRGEPQASPEAIEAAAALIRSAARQRIAGELARAWRSQLRLCLRRRREPSHGARRAWLEGRQRHHAIDFLEPRVGPRAPDGALQDHSCATRAS